jgi:hypothetical protein
MILKVWDISRVIEIFSTDTYLLLRSFINIICLFCFEKRI